MERKRLAKVCKDHGICTKNKSVEDLQDELYKKIKGGGIKDILDPLAIPKKMYQIISNELTKDDIKSGRSRPLKYGELHPTVYGTDQKTGKKGFHHSAFLGPGTRIDDPVVASFEPFNQADAAAAKHDFEYAYIQEKYKKKLITKKQREQLIRKADEELVNELNKLPPMEFKLPGLVGMNTKMLLENILGPVARVVAGPNYYGHK